MSAVSAGYMSAAIAILVLLPIASILVAIRVWIKLFKLKTFGRDDAAIIATLVSYVLYCISLTREGKQREGIEGEKQTIVWTTFGNVFYLLTSLLLKLSIGFFFLRLVTSQAVRKYVYAIIGLSTLNNFYHINFVIFQCGSPVHYVDKVLALKCVSVDVVVAHVYAHAAVNTLTDFCFALLPIQILWKSTMSRVKLVSVGFIILLGTFGSIFSVIRIPFIPGIRDDASTSMLAKLNLWSTLELSVGIIAGCLPTLSSTVQSAAVKLSKWIASSKIVWRDESGRLHVRVYTERRVSLTVETSAGNSYDKTMIGNAATVV